MISRLVILVMALGLAGVSAAALAAVIGGTPAFNADIQRLGPNGDPRVRDYWAMYHEGRYLQALGEAFLEAEQRDVPTPDEAPASQDDIEEVDAAVSRAEIAEEFLQDGLRIAPGMIRAWTALAWAAAIQGDAERAADTLAISWQLAPHNNAQSQLRVFLTGMLAESEGEAMLERLAEAGAIADFTVMERFNTGQHRALLEIVPEYRRLGEIRDAPR